MSNPFDEFDEAAPSAEGGGNPFDQFDKPSRSRADKRRGLTGAGRVFRGVDAAVRGAADALTFGYADEAAAAGDSLPALMPGGESFGDAYERNLADQRAMDQADREEMPVSRGAGQVAGFGMGLATGAVTNLGRFVPNALRGGGVAGNVARSTAAGAGYGALSSSGNADGDLGERGAAAIPGAVFGAALGAAAVPVVGAIGAGVNALSRRNAAPIDRAAHALRGRTDVAAVRARGNALRDAGAEPSFVSATDESGRGFIRAAASRMTPARETVQRRARAAAIGMQDRVVAQARRLSTDPRTPREIATELAAQRRANAKRNFGAVRGNAVQMAPETVQALRTDHARDAIREAVRRERDPEVRAALNRLANDALDNPSTEITVGMADRISRVLNGKATETRDPDLAATLYGLADDIREPTANAVPGYRSALDEYAAESKVMEAADRGEDFLKRNTDEFVADIAGPGDPGNALARATARRAVERAAGEGRGSSALSVADSLAVGREQGIRSRALLGDEDAADLARGMDAEAQITRDMTFVAPNTGAQTQPRTADQEQVSSIAEGVRTVAGGPSAWLGALMNRLKTAGLSDADAQAVADVSTNPQMLNGLVARLERIEPGRGQWLLQIINQGGGRQVGELAAPQGH